MKNPRNMVNVEEDVWKQLGVVTDSPLPRRIREGLAHGDFAKVRVVIKLLGRVVGSEAFWVKVRTISTVPVCYAGSIDNDLVHTKRHGLKVHDIIRFGPENVIEVQRVS